MAGGRSSIIGHIPWRRRQVMLELIDWRWILSPSSYPSFFSTTENLLISQDNVGWLRIIWNWHGNVSIIILASGSPETFSYLRVLLSAGYWTISSLKESGIKYCKSCKCSVVQFQHFQITSQWLSHSAGTTYLIEVLVSISSGHLSLGSVTLYSCAKT